jgi:hypothetical protein
MDYASHTRPRTPAQDRVHTVTLHTRAHGLRWLAGSALHPPCTHPPVRTVGPPGTGSRDPSPARASPLHGGLGPSGLGSTHTTRLTSLPTPHSPRLAIISHESSEARGVAQHRQTPPWSPGAYSRGPRANQRAAGARGTVPAVAQRPDPGSGPRIRFPGGTGGRDCKKESRTSPCLCPPPDLDRVAGSVDGDCIVGRHRSWTWI